MVVRRGAARRCWPGSGQRADADLCTLATTAAAPAPRSSPAHQDQVTCVSMLSIKTVLHTCAPRCARCALQAYESHKPRAPPTTASAPDHSPHRLRGREAKMVFGGAEGAQDAI
eukprot:scaffold255293_cov17-Tisochrysis_lutea.AAC.2